MRPSRTMIVLALTALALTGCATRGGPGLVAATATTDTAAAELRAAADSAGTATSARVTAHYEMTTAAGTIAYSLTGVTSIDGTETDLTGVLPASQSNGRGDVRMHQIVTDGWMYVRYDGGGMPDDWFKVKYDLFASGAAGTSTDQREQLRAMSTLNDLEKVGPETIRGVPTTHYRGTMDFSMMSAFLSSMGQPDSRSAAPGTDASPVEVWLDGKRRIVRQRMELSTTMQGETVTSSVVMDFSDWGVALDISAPAGARPFSDLTGGSSG